MLADYQASVLFTKNYNAHAHIEKVQVFALGLAGLGGTLATIHGIPANY